MSSSLILFPSYKNLPIPKWHTREKNDQPTIYRKRIANKRQFRPLSWAYRIVPTSFPTLLAYAAWSFDSFVFLLILKKTSSPEDVRTYKSSTIMERREIGVENATIRGQIVPPVHRNGGRTLMLMGAAGSSSCLAVTSPLGCSLSDMIQWL